MNADEKKALSTLSHAFTVEDIGAFWDSNTLADYWEHTRDETFDVRAVRRRRIAIVPEVYEEVETLAHARGVSPETLINPWVAERLKKTRKSRNATKSSVHVQVAGTL